VTGTRDPGSPDPAAEARLTAGRPRGAVVPIEGAGHYPRAELPPQTAAIPAPSTGPGHRPCGVSTIAG
jgi:hypothetical protein